MLQPYNPRYWFNTYIVLIYGQPECNFVSKRMKNDRSDRNRNSAEERGSGPAQPQESHSRGKPVAPQCVEAIEYVRIILRSTQVIIRNSKDRSAAVRRGRQNLNHGLCAPMDAFRAWTRRLEVGQHSPWRAGSNHCMLCCGALLGTDYYDG
jgi:hypothetical protein